MASRTTSFRETVRLLRRRAGHASARSFHRAWRRSGGACSYKTYCEIEAGRLVPTPALAARLAGALSLRPGTRAADGFRASYLFALTRRRDLTRALLEALRRDEGAADISERLLDAGLGHPRHALTRAQNALVARSPEARFALLLLQAAPRRWTSARAAAALGWERRRTEAALAALARAGLARARDGAYEGVYSDRKLIIARPTRRAFDEEAPSYYDAMPFGRWSRVALTLLRARPEQARRLARRAERLAASAYALHRRDGRGVPFCVSACVEEFPPS